MNKKCLKCIMELIFIFILPLLILLASISVTTAKTYDENNNELTEIKTIQFQNQLFSEGNGGYINKIKIKEYFVNNTPTYTANTNWLYYDTTSHVTLYYDTNYLGFIIEKASSTKQYYIYQQLNIENTTDKYLFKINCNITNNTGTYMKIFYNGNDSFTIFNELLTYGDNEYYNFFTFPSNSNIQFQIKNTSTANSVNLKIKSVELLNLTEMFGSGYEPTTIQDYNTYVNNQVFNYTQNDETIEYIGQSQISENAEEDLTVWGKIKQLLINNLNLTDNVILNIVLCYTVLWFIMFILWHCFYLFFDMLIHLFIDWGHKEKEKVK